MSSTSLLSRSSLSYHSQRSALPLSISAYRQLRTLELAHRLNSLAGVTLVLYGNPVAILYRIQPSPSPSSTLAQLTLWYLLSVSRRFQTISSASQNKLTSLTHNKNEVLPRISTLTQGWILPISNETNQWHKELRRVNDGGEEGEMYISGYN